MKNNNIYLTPGPTELYPGIDKFILESIDSKFLSINHRSKEYIKIHKSTVEKLKTLMNIPDNYSIHFVSSATECMEILLKSVVKEKSFHFLNGAFAERFYKTAIEIEKDAEFEKVEYGNSFEKIELKNTPELIAFTQNETSTGVFINPEFIYGYKNNYPDSLIAVDIVTSAPYVKLDFTQIDAAFFSVQKGFGLPSGLGVLIINDRIIEKSKELISSKYNIGSYHNILSLYEYSKIFQTTETPNILGIYLLNKVTENMLEKGIEKIRMETDKKADLIYNFFDNFEYKPFVKLKSDRSPTIIVIETKDKTEEIKEILKSENIIVGGGYGKFKDSQIRIANFPGQKIEVYEKLTNILSKF